MAKVGFNASLIFYDSMLGDVTTPERMDEISSLGFGWGYIGSCIPFVASLIIVLGKDALGLPIQTSMLLSFVLVAAWWLVVLFIAGIVLFMRGIGIVKKNEPS